MLEPRLSAQLNHLMIEANKLRTQYEHDIAEGKTFEEVKTVYLEFKKVIQQIERLEIIASNTDDLSN